MGGMGFIFEKRITYIMSMTDDSIRVKKKNYQNSFQNNLTRIESSSNVNSTNREGGTAASLFTQ